MKMENEMNGFDRFDNESLTVSYKSNTKEVSNLSGWKHKETQEVIFDPKTDSAERYSNAYDELIKKERIETSIFLKKTRIKLKLSQQKASKITGGGHNAFSRYETNAAKPLPSVVNLFKILNERPELLSLIS